MTYHVHIGVLQGFVGFLFVLLFGTLTRLIAMHNKDNAFGKALAFMY